MAMGAVPVYRYPDVPVEYLDRAKLWGELNAERVSATTLDQAVAEYLHERQSVFLSEDWRVGVVRFSGLVPMALPRVNDQADWVLEWLLEHLDEDYADPEGVGSTKPTPAMIEAARKMVDVVHAEYRVWPHEAIVDVDVNVAQWLMTVDGAWLE